MKVLKKFKDYTVILLSLFLITSTLTGQSAHALVQVPTLRFGLGMFPLKFTAGTVAAEPTELGSMVTLQPMFLWDIPGLRSRVGFHFLTDLGSKYGFVSTAGIGLTAIFYPTGLSSAREVSDNDSSIIKTKVSPYFQFSVTPTKFSITIPEDGVAQNLLSYFSTSIIETSFGAGVDYPFSANLVGFIGIHYRLAVISDQETTTGALNYKGMGILAGVMTNFY